MTTMWEGRDLSQFGAVVRDPSYLDIWARNGIFADSGPVLDFGLSPRMAEPSARTFTTTAPHLRGRWDGESFSLWEVGRKQQGKYLRAQRQTLGTCVSRGWSLGLNLLQFSMAAAGLPIDFKEVAHAPIYGGSREIGGMLAPPGRDGSYGEAASKSVLRIGNAYLQEINDDYDSDEIAGQMGWRGVPANVKELCKDNLATDTALITSFAEAADAIFNGHPVAVCSGQGFTMTRDPDGFCSPLGSWSHCMLFGSVFSRKSSAAVPFTGDRRGLGCGQSWGQMTPDGPLLLGCPDNVFGVEDYVCDRMLAGRDSYAIAGMQAWLLQSWPLTWKLW